jgi:hypothetical protein
MLGMHWAWPVAETCARLLTGFDWPAWFAGSA